MRGPTTPAGFTAGEFAAALLRAYVLFLVLTPVAFLLWARPWVGVTAREFWNGLGFAFVLWLEFVVAAGLVVIVIGCPIALALALLLRPVRRPAAHLAAHGTAAILVCLGLGVVPSVLSGSDPIATVNMVLGIYWPWIAACVVSTCGGWLLTARSIRRTDAKRMAAPRPPVFGQARSVSTRSSEFDAAEAGPASDRGLA